MQTTLKLALSALALAASGAQAASIISPTSTITAPAVVVDFNNFDNLLSSGPLELGATTGSVVLTAGSEARVGADQQSLDENGLWGARGDPVNGLLATPTGDGNFLASTGSGTGAAGTVSFTFDTPVQEVGAYFNQFQTAGASSGLRLVAYDQAGAEIESFTYTVDTDMDGYNEGMFLGFTRASADIYGFGIAGDTFVVDNLMLAAVPEPGSYALMLGGLAALALRAHRRLEG